jgi:alanyl-tRNA synthetase
MSTAAEVAWPANKVRETFVNFFQDKCAHVNYKSSPVVPHDDPTLLFANAGMNRALPPPWRPLLCAAVPWPGG